jgi:hypothetical protein
MTTYVVFYFVGVTGTIVPDDHSSDNQDGEIAGLPYVIVFCPSISGKTRAAYVVVPPWAG